MQKLDHILYRKMSRKEFLGVIGLDVISLLGLPALIGILSGNDKHTSSTAAPLTYGNGSYGGVSKSTA